MIFSRTRLLFLRLFFSLLGLLFGFGSLKFKKSSTKNFKLILEINKIRTILELFPKPVIEHFFAHRDEFLEGSEESQLCIVEVRPREVGLRPLVRARQLDDSRHVLEFSRVIDPEK